MAVAPCLHASRLCIVCFLFRLQSLFPLRALTSVKHYIAELAKMAILPEISGRRNGPPLNGQWLFFCFVLFFLLWHMYGSPLPIWVSQVSNFPRSPKFCSVNFETFTITDSLFSSTPPPEVEAPQVISACRDISDPFNFSTNYWCGFGFAAVLYSVVLLRNVFLGDNKNGT